MSKYTRSTWWPFARRSTQSLFSTETGLSTLRSRTLARWAMLNLRSSAVPESVSTEVTAASGNILQNWIVSQPTFAVASRIVAGGDLTSAA
jgi:hypothetical protein